MKNVVMSVITFIVVGLAIQNAQAQQIQFDVNDTLYVCAYNGLNLRQSANTHSEVITKLAHADEVTVLEVTAELLEIDHRQSSWLKVEYDGYTGYLFGGYLTSVEPMYLESYSFDCNTDMYYLDWVSDVIGEAQVVSHQNLNAQKSRSGKGVETTTYKAYTSGDVFYNKVGPSTDSYYFESNSLSYNDVLNFMEYLVACQNRYCASNVSEDKAIFRPIKNLYGKLVRVDCTTPLSMTAQQHGDKMVVKLETCL